MFWWILVIVLFVVGTVCIIYYNVSGGLHDWPWIVTIGAYILCIFICFLTIAQLLSYKEFEKKYDIQQKYYETLTEHYDFSNAELTYIMDVFEVNDELATYQASYQQYGSFFTVIPKRVMEFSPIGLDKME